MEYNLGLIALLSTNQNWVILLIVLYTKNYTYSTLVVDIVPEHLSILTQMVWRGNRGLL